MTPKNVSHNTQHGIEICKRSDSQTVVVRFLILRSVKDMNCLEVDV